LSVVVGVVECGFGCGSVVVVLSVVLVVEVLVAVVLVVVVGNMACTL
jgi:hypothetical protein